MTGLARKMPFALTFLSENSDPQAEVLLQVFATEKRVNLTPNSVCLIANAIRLTAKACATFPDLSDPKGGSQPSPASAAMPLQGWKCQRDHTESGTGELPHQDCIFANLCKVLSRARAGDRSLSTWKHSWGTTQHHPPAPSLDTADTSPCSCDALYMHPNTASSWSGFVQRPAHEGPGPWVAPRHFHTAEE